MRNLEPVNLSATTARVVRWPVGLKLLLGALGALAFAGLATIVIFTWLLFGRQGVPVVISHETTRVTEPLCPDGSVDFLAAVNRKTSEGVAANDNAAVLIWRGLGAPDDPSVAEIFFNQLGVEELFEDPFVDVVEFALLLPSPATTNDAQPETPLGPSAEPKNQLEEATTRPWMEDEFPLLANWLETNEAALGFAVDASLRPRLYAPLVAPPDAKFPCIDAEPMTAFKTRALCNALVARAMLKTAGSHTAAAWDDLLAVQRLSRLVMQGPTLVDALAGMNIQEVACKATPVLVEHAELDSRHLAQMLAQLDELPIVSPMVDKMDYFERLMVIEGVCRIARGLDDRVLDQLGGLRRRPVDWNFALELVNAEWDRQVAAWNLSARAEQNAELDRLQHDLGRRAAEARSVRGMMTMLVGSKRAMAAQIVDVYLAMVTPPTAAACDCRHRIEMRLALTRLAIALAAYRADRGQYPGQLAELVPRYIAQVPDDLFAAGPIGYTVTAAGCVLHSVGFDGNDDRVLEQSVSDYVPDDESDDLTVHMRAVVPPSAQQ
jgi:hypothetical protein